jgi:hypothetical protein
MRVIHQRGISSGEPREFFAKGKIFYPLGMAFVIKVLVKIGQGP